MSKQIHPVNGLISDAHGEKVSFHLLFHVCGVFFSDDHTVDLSKTKSLKCALQLQAVIADVERCNLHSSPSSFHVTTETQMTGQSPSILRVALTHQHLVITDLSSPSYDFDERGLQTIKPLNAIIDIFGKSFKHFVFLPLSSTFF